MFRLGRDLLLILDDSPLTSLLLGLTLELLLLLLWWWWSGSSLEPLLRNTLRGVLLKLLLRNTLRWLLLGNTLRWLLLKLLLRWGSPLELSLLRNLLGHLTLELLLVLRLLELSWLGRRRRVATLELALWHLRLLILLRVHAWRGSVLAGDSDGQEEDGDNVVVELYHGQAGRDTLYSVLMYLKSSINHSVLGCPHLTSLQCSSLSTIKEHLEIKIYFLVQLTVTLIDYSVLSVCFRSNSVLIIINLTEKKSNREIEKASCNGQVTCE